jgi:predicted PurR-regulated permease PerM
MNRYPDPPPQPGGVASERLLYSQRFARAVLTIALVLLGLWILHRFLPALAWAGVLAIALWPLYRLECFLGAKKAFSPRSSSRC